MKVGRGLRSPPRLQCYCRSERFSGTRRLHGSKVVRCFLSPNAAQRATNTLCHDEIAKSVFAAAANYHERGRWHIHLLLLMPDHVHALLSFPQVESMSQVIRSWKHYLTKQHGLDWQRDYFDHRVRDHSSLQEKAAYIRQNPVRAGLVETPEQWRFAWVPEQ